ncbi:glycosyltransferase family 4 protein [Candidatus Woesebacteria bacterium]|nr:glycosyltransferase family 4 protein [Candidatus Woesebacteria bacterium]
MKNKKLSITYLDFDDMKNPLLGAGQARATYEVCSRLTNKGHRIKVICSKYPGYKDRIEDGISYKHIGLPTGNIRLNNIIYILLLPFYVLSLKSDIIVECFTSPISTLFSPVFTKIPVVALSTSFEADRFAKLYHLPFDKIERFGLRFYRYFLPSSKYFKEKIEKYNKKVISKIVYQGVEDIYFGIKHNRPEHILFLGRLDMGQKGIDILLKAYSKVKDKIGYPLIIVGNGPDEYKIKKIVRDLGLSKKVRLVGPAFGKKKYDYFSRSVFCAVPSRHEGFCILCLEALAAGLPVACFDIPGLCWLDEKVIGKVEAFNINKYSEKLLELANSKIREEKCEKLRKFASKFTWDKVAQNYEDFFYKILEREARS